MIRNALTGEPKAEPKTLAQQKSDFTAEGAPPPGALPVPPAEASTPEPTASTPPPAR
jgi:hypothetical protein